MVRPAGASHLISSHLIRECLSTCYTSRQQAVTHPSIHAIHPSHHHPLLHAIPSYKPGFPIRTLYVTRVHSIMDSAQRSNTCADVSRLGGDLDGYVGHWCAALSLVWVCNSTWPTRRALGAICLFCLDCTRTCRSTHLSTWQGMLPLGGGDSAPVYPRHGISGASRVS